MKIKQRSIIVNIKASLLRQQTLWKSHPAAVVGAKGKRGAEYGVPES